VSHSCGEKFAEIEVLPIARARNRDARSAASTLSGKSRTRPGQKCNAERSRFTCERHIRAAAISRVRGDISPFTDTRDNSHNLCNLDRALPMRSGLVNEPLFQWERRGRQTRLWGYGKGSSKGILVACIPNSQEIQKDTCYVLRSVCILRYLWSRGQDNQTVKRSFMKRHLSRLMHPRCWSSRLNLGNAKY